MVYGADIKQLHPWLGDGYSGFSVVDARNAMYLGDAIEVLHSFGGWQLHDNYFGRPGDTDIGDREGLQRARAIQHQPRPAPVASAGVLGPGSGSHLERSSGCSTTWTSTPRRAPTRRSTSVKKLKFGAEMTYLPLDWFGVGFRGDVVQPNLDNSATNFSVFSPRLIFRTAFVTHEQIMIQYSRYFVGARASAGMFPYNTQAGAGRLHGRRQECGADRRDHLVLNDRRHEDDDEDSSETSGGNVVDGLARARRLHQAAAGIGPGSGARIGGVDWRRRDGGARRRPGRAGPGRRLRPLRRRPRWRARRSATPGSRSARPRA